MRECRVERGPFDPSLEEPAWRPAPSLLLVDRPSRTDQRAGAPRQRPLPPHPRPGPEPFGQPESLAEAIRAAAVQVEAVTGDRRAVLVGDSARLAGDRPFHRGIRRDVDDGAA